MKLADLTLPISYADGRSLALVFTPQLAERLAELYALHGRPDCRATPRQTTDGRWFLTADILTATEPGGYLHEMWQHADKSILLPAVEVLPIADALALLPSDPLPEPSAPATPPNSGTPVVGPTGGGTFRRR